MELTALNENHAAVERYPVGTVVELDAGTGVIDEAVTAPNGQTYYAINFKLPSGAPAMCTRWHDEIALHPIDAAVMAIAADDELANDAPPLPGLVRCEATSAVDPIAASSFIRNAPGLAVDPIADKFRAMLDKGAAIIASIETIKPGDLVVLKSGGPQMLVESIVENDTRALTCWWMDHTANLHVARFPRELVKLVPSFNHAEMRA